MNVSELINNLAAFAAQSPENAHAEVMLKFDGDICFEIGRADDCRAMGGVHFLVLVPDERGKRIGIREMKIQ